MGATLSNAQKNDVRRWLGYSRIYTQLYPKLENAMVAINSVADGGSQPDDSAVLLVQSWLSTLDTLEGQEVQLSCQMAVMTAGTDMVTLDAAGKGIYGLRKIMKRYIGHMSDTLSTKPFRDVFIPVQQTQETEEQQQATRVFSDYGQ